MRKWFVLFATFAFVLSSNFAAAQVCDKIKDGTIRDSAGNPIQLGYDQHGYNYQARLFNGTYDSSDRSNDGLYWGSAGDYTDDSLIMKWSEEWLSNQDCTGDGKLDRGGWSGVSKGWLTNQIEGDYIGTDGDAHHYTYFAKIVYDGGAACSAGQPTCLWSLYAIVQEVYNDPHGGYHGVNRSWLTKPGLGHWK